MIGVDVTSVARMREAVCNENFINRVFTRSERDYCMSRSDPPSSFAGVYCAKEAVVKALKCGFGRGIMPADIEITHETDGAPRVIAHGNAVEALRHCDADVSISHDGDYAIAVAELLKRQR